MNTSLLAPVIRFNEALNVRDIDTMLSLLTADCLFENTSPAPDGTQYIGQQAVRKFWEEFFRNSSEAHIAIEEIYGQHERVVMRWTYHWIDRAGRSGHIRGVDLYRLQNGLIAEKLSYVKG